MNDRNEAESEQAVNFPLAEMMRDYLRAAMRAALYEVAESELTELCGPLHRPDADSPYRRAGSAKSTVYLEGNPECLKRPRVRRREGDQEVEVKLESWKAAQDPEQWKEATMRAILCGVSTRDVGRLGTDQTRAMSKSAVSRLWQKKAAELVDEMQQSDLSDFDLLILMIDAVVLAKGLVATVALGIDTTGRKRILGFRVGGSENREVCMDLLSSLSARGLKKPSWRRLLAVLDGSEALRSALLSHYPDTLVQRCLVHKQRNLRGYLSKRHWGELNRLFSNLRKAQGEKQAEKAAEVIRAFLKDKNAQARQSFEEAGEDLLRLFRLEAPNTLHRSLLSTNCIENAFKNLRRHLGRVCRWRADTDQADRWMASGLKLAEKGFRRIVGCEDLPLLVAALRKPPQKAAA
jgi:transposase-like protein